MQIAPIPTLSNEINDIRTKTANIVSEQIIPNESKIYKGGDNAKSIRSEIRETVKSENLWAPHLPQEYGGCLLYTSPSPRDLSTSRMPSSA